MGSQVRQNFHPDCEAAINRTVNLKYYTSYVYLSMSFYFDRHDVALENFSKFFRERSKAEQEHAEKFIKYQTQRGGRVFLQNIEKPLTDEWTNGLEAMQCALTLQRNVNQNLLELHKMADEKGDPQMCNFLDSNFLTDSVEVIKNLGDFVTSLRKLMACQEGMGEYLFEKHTLN
ncbi:ferritin, lower subunit-like [Latimeria chalumnae]|uniref:Ferritin n=1 Tax=Latimeria chalumnae TaxID=7897 RepID=H3BE79_LATCH|nr:PREDICTED: ferritin, lower subunit-like [Latimeria chalumnae]|eukprot:XP_005991027.1 PREDICTED: ferritin, lower subunit-like [Latimeria chalumnae]